MKADGLNTFRTNYLTDPTDNATLVQTIQYANSIGMTPDLIVQNVGQAQAAVAQFGSGANYEFMNEAYSGDSGSTSPYTPPKPSEYASQAQQAYQDIKAVSPTSQFYIDGNGGSATQWTEQVIQDMNGEFDAVSIHPYGVWAPDGQNQPTSQEADALAQTIPALETSLQQANNGNPVNLDITETGWNNPQGQENYTPEFINDMSSLPYVTGLDVYDWVDTQGFGVSGTAAQQPTDTALDQFATAGSVASDRGTSS